MNLFARIYCKLVECILHVRTFLLHGPRVWLDPTWLLVRYQSPAQIEATRQIAAELKIAAPEPFDSREFDSAVTQRAAELVREKEKMQVAVIIPFRDAWAMTQKCIESLFAQNREHLNLTLCLVDNNSREQATADGLSDFIEKWTSNSANSHKEIPKVHLIKDTRPFNFSQLNNSAAHFLSHSSDGPRPDFLLFLNNDTLWQDSNSLEKLVFFAASSDKIGAVGCTLIYENSKVQHLFLAPGVKLAGAHPCKGIPLKFENLWYTQPRPVPAVTGALLLISADHFERVQGFDEALATSCQDLDLCLKVQSLGCVNWVLPRVCVKHFETRTRLKRNQGEEIQYISMKWGIKLSMNPYLAHEISRWSERPAYSWKESVYPWQMVLNLNPR